MTDRLMLPPEPNPIDERLPFPPAVGCVLAVLVGLFCAGVFFAALWMTQRGEIAYAPEPYRAVRVWIVRSDGGSGLGLSTTLPRPGGSADRVCAETTVRFLLTRAEDSPSDVSFCECFERSGDAWSPAGECSE